ncbi:MAG TPA: hypothetical protein PKD26_02590 [Pyrinomonadaceae bacterium]|nr:hypothetical protein [Pyrinomonadaceae bacterium]
MSARPVFVILALILSNLILFGCSVEPGSNSNQAVTNTRPAATFDPVREGVKDNKDELGELIKLPFEPEDLVWKEFPPDKNGKRILAVFQLLPDDSKKLSDRLSKAAKGAEVKLRVEKWFPTELITENDLTGEEGIVATSYPATDFFHPPFVEGTVSRVGSSDFYVLDLLARQ